MSDPPPDEPFDVGDRVRIDIPDENRGDHNFHGKNGEIIAWIPTSDQAPPTAPSDGRYRVALDVGGTVDVWPQDVRPPI